MGPRFQDLRMFGSWGLEIGIPGLVFTCCGQVSEHEAQISGLGLQLSRQA